MTAIDKDTIIDLKKEFPLSLRLLIKRATPPLIVLAGFTCAYLWSITAGPHASSFNPALHQRFQLFYYVLLAFLLVKTVMSYVERETTEYYVRGDSLIVKTGLFRPAQSEFRLHHALIISELHGLLDLLLGTRTVRFYTVREVVDSFADISGISAANAEALVKRIRSLTDELMKAEAVIRERKKTMH